jgi:hypothetical protein
VCRYRPIETRITKPPYLGTGSAFVIDIKNVFHRSQGNEPPAYRFFHIRTPEETACDQVAMVGDMV